MNKYKAERLGAAVDIRAHKLMRRKFTRIHCREWYIRIDNLTGRYIATCRIRAKRRRIFVASEVLFGFYSEVRYNV